MPGLHATKLSERRPSGALWRRELMREIHSLRMIMVLPADSRRFPRTLELLAKAEYWQDRGKGRTFSLHGETYRLAVSNLGRLIVLTADGESLVSSFTN